MDSYQPLQEIWNTPHWMYGKSDSKYPVHTGPGPGHGETGHCQCSELREPQSGTGSPPRRGARPAPWPGADLYRVFRSGVHRGNS